jgi:allophanate hydrolase subunit 2
VLHLRPGPRVDWLGEESWAALDRATYVVAPDSDRIGLRLDGPQVRRRAGELPSEGMVLGAVQLPASGQPVVFLADHPPTGGYPVVAVVEDGDLDLCAQLRPGDVVVLRTG